MSTIFGESGSVKLATGVVAEIRNFKLSKSAAILDAHVMGGNGWDKKKGGVKGWSADIECFYDPADTTGQHSVEVGDELANVDMYPEGDTSSLMFYSGPAIVETVDVSVSHDGLTELSMKVIGNGALVYAAVV